jgi:hypothetical protein
MEIQRAIRLQDSHIYQTIGSQMAAMFSALRVGHPLPQEDSWHSFLLKAE